MRLASLVVTMFALLSPLPGLPALPEGSGVTVYHENGLSKLASGTVRAGRLSLSPGLPKQGTVVNVLIGVPSAGEPLAKTFSGNVVDGGADIELNLDGGKVSFKRVLADVYGVRLELKR